MSWILEIRGRLATPSPNRLQGEPESRFAILLPIYVEAGELWVLLGEGEDGAAIFYGRTLEGLDDGWQTVREAAKDLGLDPAAVLRLGELDELGSSQERLLTWIGAIPTPKGEELPKGVFSIPLRALEAPSMVEEREGSEGAPVKVVHLGRRRLWGVPLWVLELLMARLGMASST